MTTFNCFDQFLKKSLVNCQNKGQWFAIDRFGSDKTNFFERILCNFCSFPYQYCDLFLAEKEKRILNSFVLESTRFALIVYTAPVCIMWQRHNTNKYFIHFKWLLCCSLSLVMPLEWFLEWEMLNCVKKLFCRALAKIPLQKVWYINPFGTSLFWYCLLFPENILVQKRLYVIIFCLVFLAAKMQLYKSYILQVP